MMAVSFLLFSLSLSLVLSDPPSNITIDGNFDDWDNIPKVQDPFATADNPFPKDGFPLAPDVHNSDETMDQCFIRTAESNPYADIIETALAHDYSRVYVYFKAVGSIGESLKEI